MITFLPIWIPGLSASTMKPVKALLAGACWSGSVRASRKYLGRTEMGAQLIPNNQTLHGKNAEWFCPYLYCTENRVVR